MGVLTTCGCQRVLQLPSSPLYYCRLVPLIVASCCNKSSLCFSFGHYYSSSSIYRSFFPIPSSSKLGNCGFHRKISKSRRRGRVGLPGDLPEAKQQSETVLHNDEEDDSGKQQQQPQPQQQEGGKSEFGNDNQPRVATVIVGEAFSLGNSAIISACFVGLLTGISVVVFNNALALIEPSSLKTLDAYIEFRERGHLVQFLTALSPQYEAVHSGILHRSPLPSVDAIVRELLSQETRLKTAKSQSYKEACQDPHWVQAMEDELAALQKISTWELVLLPAGKNLVGYKWVYKVKTHSNGSLERYKARLMDVKNTFLNGHLTEEVYMRPPPGLHHFSGQVCRLWRALYGLKQSPRALYNRFQTAVTEFGFHPSASDSALFLKHTSAGFVALLLYVNDMIIIGSDSSAIFEVKQHLFRTFEMKDLVIHRAGLTDTKVFDTPIELNVKLNSTDGIPLDDPTLYRELVDCLVYLIVTRPDLAYAVHVVHELRDFFWGEIPYRGASWLREEPVEVIRERVIIVPVCGGIIVGMLNELRGTLEDPTKITFMSDVKAALEPILKTLAACITLGTGNSLGPEGPSVEIGASIAKGVGTLFDRSAQRKLSLVAAGSAAGISSGCHFPIAIVCEITYMHMILH
ncbi:hypothetical protein HYC85_009157 [Camellia sinensis]|uniref:Reverse transcriptase Ty1/copia-type domain-containing protein n=1 Tax=Camellia sinensis TaxID=4442 RepID=A0A7J7HE89_CAMSI|nr:hypothetical protein HYC85_009157 [Camellia sinensis]